ncbi:hypothetical protein F8388_000002 [Cannabis sativa]|uniref:Uncharacterized protein n=1 Tax=Cannabis sativa TaxID=3483 RepID=A0A7J6EP01_CANSA|nr:hypothetical protein F8388_000002 [Cannabis sativa]
MVGEERLSHMLSTVLAYETKPQIAKTIAIALTPSIFSWKKNTAIIGTIGEPKTLMTLEKSEETSSTKPTTPMKFKPDPAEAPNVQINPIAYFPFEILEEEEEESCDSGSKTSKREEMVAIACPQRTKNE